MNNIIGKRVAVTVLLRLVHFVLKRKIFVVIIRFAAKIAQRIRQGCILQKVAAHKFFRYCNAAQGQKAVGARSICEAYCSSSKSANGAKFLPIKIKGIGAMLRRERSSVTSSIYSPPLCGLWSLVITNSVRSSISPRRDASLKKF